MQGVKLSCGLQINIKALWLSLCSIIGTSDDHEVAAIHMLEKVAWALISSSNGIAPSTVH